MSKMESETIREIREERRDAGKLAQRPGGGGKEMPQRQSR